MNNQSTDGVKYLTNDDLADYTGANKSAIASAAHANGIKILNATDTAAMKSISEASDDLSQLGDALQKVATVDPGLLQRGMAMTMQDLAAAAQTNPDLAALSVYRDIAPKVSMALSGMKSMRNGSLISQMANSLPQPTDTQAMQQQKLANIQNLLKGNEKEILGTGAKTSGSAGRPLSNFFNNLLGGGTGKASSSSSALGYTAPWNAAPTPAYNPSYL
jgi:hypothetical protein